MTEPIPTILPGEFPTGEQTRAFDLWQRAHPGLWRSGEIVTANLLNGAIHWVNEGRKYVEVTSA